MNKDECKRVWISRDGDKDNVYFYIDTKKPIGKSMTFDWKGLKIGRSAEFEIRRVKKGGGKK